MSSEIAIPFALTADGRIAVVTNPDDQIKQHVEALITTEPTERVMLPTYGIPLSSMVFELDDDITQSHILQLVTAALSTWEPGVQVLNARQVQNQHGDGISAIEVDYVRKESATSNVVGAKVNTAFIDIDGKVTEIVRG